MKQELAQDNKTWSKKELQKMAENRSKPISLEEDGINEGWNEAGVVGAWAFRSQCH